MDFQKEKKKIFEELEIEKNQLKQWAAKKENEVELLKTQLRGSTETSAAQVKVNFDKKLFEITSEHEEEMKRMRRRLEAEKTAWQETYSRNQVCI